MSGLSRIRLELARAEGFPDGTSAIGYDLVAPVDADGKLDPAAWAKAKDACTVRHFANAHQERGRLRFGDEHGWYFDYAHDETEDDEPLFRLDEHILKPGEYVSVREHNGKLMTFKVVSIEPA